MQRVAGLIYVAAVAFIRRQYRTIALLALGGAVLIGAVVYFFEHVEGITSAELAIRTAVAFLVGAVASMLSGIIGMFVAVKSNLRTGAAAQHSIGDALRISLRGGAGSRDLFVAPLLIRGVVMFLAYNGLGKPGPAAFLFLRVGVRAAFVA